jgi:hypothetical protein
VIRISAAGLEELDDSVIEPIAEQAVETIR